MKTNKLFLVALILSIGAQALAYPISPRPLRKLILESEYIITGFVLDVKEQRKKKDDDWFGGYWAHVRVAQVLQGQMADSVIKVPFNPNMICPAPPHFEKGTHVLVFLNKTKEGYHVHALSYGVKTLSTSELQTYAARITEMQTILQIPDRDEQFKQTIGWLVACAENPATRHEGVYELTPESDFMSYYDRTEKQPFQYMLTSEHKLRLKNALLADTANQYTDFGLVDLVYAGNEAEVFNHLLQGLGRITENQLWYADEFMRRLVLYKPAGRLEKLIEEYDDKKFNDNMDNKKLLTMIDTFIKEINSQ